MRIIKVLLPACLGILSVLGFIQIAAQANSMEALSNAKIIYVDAYAGGAANGLNWTNAYTSLQDALDTAAFGDQIWVAKGIYYPDEGREQTNDVVSSTFKLVDGVKLYGGFDPHNAIDEFSERDWQSNVSVLSADIDHETMPDITDLNGVVTTTENITGSNAFHVVYGINISDATVVDGFTITAGHAREVEGQSQDFSGGGLYNISNSSPMLSNIIFSGNSAILGGGVCNLSLSHPTFLHVTFHGNRANIGGGILNFTNSYTNTISMSDITFTHNIGFGEGGGGMYNHSSTVKLMGATFHENSGIHGGGLINDRGILTLSDAVFTGNSVTEHGGGIVVTYSTLTMTNVILSGNSAGLSGGGLLIENRIDYSSTMTITNLTIVNNIADQGGGIVQSTVNEPQISNMILWGNTADEGSQIYNGNNFLVFRHSLIQGSGGSGDNWDASIGIDGGNNMDSDPLFVRNPSPGDGNWETIDDNDYGDLHLQPDSPAIDAGDNASCPLFDLDGRSRPINICDLGVYEYGLLLYFPLINQQSQ